MQKELQCTKIKDGLYLGNIRTAQDAQFLITNKFAFIINCSAEIANFYEGQGIKYLKFKLIRDKSHKLWDQTLKKLKKLDKFIQNCQQNSMCCLIHSYDGVNRSLVILVAFLMNRYRWKLGKTLQFVRSKEIFIGLSEHYIQQLQILEQILNNSQPNLTSEWRIQYRSSQEQIISKTFLNSQQIQIKQQRKGEKKTKRVVWKDLVQKQRKKQQKLMIKQQQKQRGLRVMQNMEEKPVIDLTKIQSKQVLQKKKAKSQQQPKKQIAGLKRQKISGNRSKPQIVLHQSQQLNLKSADKYKQKDNILQQQGMVDEGQIFDLIKKNLKSKKKIENACTSGVNQNQQRIYNVTINNYIKPNINILNGIPEKKKANKKRPQSAWKKCKPL